MSEITVCKQDKVYITVEGEREKVIDGLVKKGFLHSQLCIATKEEPNYFDEFFRYFYERYHIDVTRNWLQMKEVKIFNFIKISKDFEKAFRETIGEEILPGVYGDVALAVEGPYELFDVMVEKGDIVLDIGANLGLFSCYAASKGAKVYACDPDTRCVDILKEQQKIYPQMISVLPIGLSDSVRKNIFYETDICTRSSFLGEREEEMVEREINVETIDYLVEMGKLNRVDFIKADIEGEERNMLRGAVHTLKTQAPKLSICTYHYPEDPQLLEKIIKDANPNYKIVHAYRKLYAWVEK